MERARASEGLCWVFDVTERRVRNIDHMGSFEVLPAVFRGRTKVGDIAELYISVMQVVCECDRRAHKLV